jgi:biopolymer transport protein ExbD
MRVKRPESTTVSANMTPMIDMVFNLLIFFILTAQFVSLETEDVVLPISKMGEVKDYTNFRNIVINIVHPEDPQIMVMHKVMTPPELTEFLKSVHDDAGQQSVNVILRADADVPYEDVARVMLATGAAKIQGWWITTERDKEAMKTAL